VGLEKTATSHALAARKICLGPFSFSCDHAACSDFQTNNTKEGACGGLPFPCRVVGFMFSGGGGKNQYMYSSKQSLGKKNARLTPGGMVGNINGNGHLFDPETSALQGLACS